MAIANVAKNIARGRGPLREASRRARTRLAVLGARRGSVPGFVHIPKTGGTYIAQFGNARRPSVWPVLNFGHRVIAGERRATMPGPSQAGRGGDAAGRSFRFTRVVPAARARRCFLCATCRNPFDLLVSYWFFCAGEPSRGDHDLATGPFDDFVARLAERAEPWPGGGFEGGLLHHQMFNLDGAFVIDWVFRSESLDADAEAMARHLRVRYTPGARSRTSDRDKDYRAYYTDAARALVEHTWANDLALFGYTFDGPVERPGLHRLVPEDVKAALRYDRPTGTLELPHGWAVPGGSSAASAGADDLAAGSGGRG